MSLAPVAPTLPPASVNSLLTVTELVSSNRRSAVNVAVQVTPPSPLVRPPSVPLNRHVALSKPVTASEKVIVTIELLSLS